MHRFMKYQFLSNVKRSFSWNCIVSKNGFSKSVILYAEHESQIILTSENDVCSKIRTIIIIITRLIYEKHKRFLT